jgi:hydrogenase maturation factor HypE
MKEGSTSTLAYSLYANDGSPWPSLTVRISGSDREATGTSPLALNTWTHLAATYDGANMRIYVNGVQVGSRAQTGNMLTSNRTLRIGGNSIWGEYFNGLIDDVRVYNRALSATEIQTDMNTPVR